MFEGIFIDARAPRAPLIASLCLHGVFIAFVAAFTHAKVLLPWSEEGVSVKFLSPPPAGYRTPPFRQPARARISRQAPAHKLIQPNALPHPAERQPLSPPRPQAATEGIDENEDPGFGGGEADGNVMGVAGGDLGGQAPQQQDAPVLLGSGMSRPQPEGECAPGGMRPRPQMPEQARAMGIAGTVLVEYVVHADGSVSNVTLRNEGAPRQLFEATSKWLLTCTFTPSVSGGRQMPVRMIQPFTFKLQ
jgi:TonB family protein